MAELKYYIFFDFEMLCSNRGMAYEAMEAIRLGAVKYEIETEEISYFDQYIRPRSRKPLTAFCKALTGIKDEDLAGANNFEHVFAAFLTWVGGIKKSRFFSWSKSDLIRLQHDAHLHGISSTTLAKIEARYIDFRYVLTKRVSQSNLSVENALKLYHLEFIGDQHNPMYDALNTLRIYLSFLNNPLQSDLIMLEHFILGDKCRNMSEVNGKVEKNLKQDIETFLSNLHHMYKIGQAQKVLKKTKQLVRKYENILVNRSGIFSQEIIDCIRLLKGFYNELSITYKEHFIHSSKVMILDDHMVNPIKQIAI